MGNFSLLYRYWWIFYPQPLYSTLIFPNAATNQARNVRKSGPVSRNRSLHIRASNIHRVRSIDRSACMCPLPPLCYPSAILLINPTVFALPLALNKGNTRAPSAQKPAKREARAKKQTSLIGKKLMKLFRPVGCEIWVRVGRPQIYWVRFSRSLIYKNCQPRSFFFEAKGKCEAGQMAVALVLVESNG